MAWVVPSKQNRCVDTVLLAIHAFCWDPSEASPFCTAFIPARAAPAHERVIRTLRACNIHIDEALFLGGMDKGEFRKAFGATLLLDDQQGHCESARQRGTTGRVPYRVGNRAVRLARLAA